MCIRDSLDLVEACEGEPVVPPLIADIAGGAHEAMINILLALRGRDQTGLGAYLDIAMIDGLFPFMLSAIANWVSHNSVPKAGSDLLTGASPRYQLYRTSDSQHLAVAAFEERFWQRFSELIQLPTKSRSRDSDPGLIRKEISDIVVKRSARYWQMKFKGEDVCCTIVRSLADALNDPDMLKRNRIVLGYNPRINLLSLSAGTELARVPDYGEHNRFFGF